MIFERDDLESGNLTPVDNFMRDALIVIQDGETNFASLMVHLECSVKIKKVTVLCLMRLCEGEIYRWIDASQVLDVRGSLR